MWKLFEKFSVEYFCRMVIFVDFGVVVLKFVEFLYQVDVVKMKFKEKVDYLG